jgi:hypothetical protein
VPEMRLEAQEFSGPTQWRWVLTDATSGEVLAEHAVQLDDGAWQYEAFTNLQEYVSRHAAPDRHLQDETRIAGDVGEWIGSQVLGTRITATLAGAAEREPVTVRVLIPADAALLMFRPLELACTGGVPLSLRKVTFVVQAGACRPPVTSPVRERLRVLGLFSLPEGSQPLSLGPHRHIDANYVCRASTSLIGELDRREVTGARWATPDEMRDLNVPPELPGILRAAIRWAASLTPAEPVP